MRIGIFPWIQRNEPESCGIPRIWQHTSFTRKIFFFNEWNNAIYTKKGLLPTAIQ